MPSRLQTGTTALLVPGETSTRKIVEAVNGVAEQAFAPFSLEAVGAGQQTINSSGMADLTGLTLSFSVAVPCQATVHAKLTMKCTIHVAGETLWAAIVQDGAIAARSWATWTAGAANDYMTIPLQLIATGLLPETVYAIKLQAAIFSRTTSAYIVERGYSSLIVTTEARQF